MARHLFFAIALIGFGVLQFTRRSNESREM